MLVAAGVGSRGVRGRRRFGLAAVELAVALPMLCFVSAATIDFARVAYYEQAVANFARNGALWAAYQSNTAVAPSNAFTSTYTSIDEAALADASNFGTAPTITNASGTDASGNAYVRVTASYNFSTVLNYPGIPASFTITRSATMAVAP